MRKFQNYSCAFGSFHVVSSKSDSEGAQHVESWCGSNWNFGPTLSLHIRFGSGFGLRWELRVELKSENSAQFHLWVIMLRVFKYCSQLDTLSICTWLIVINWSIATDTTRRARWLQKEYCQCSFLIIAIKFKPISKESELECFRVACLCVN